MLRRGTLVLVIFIGLSGLAVLSWSQEPRSYGHKKAVTQDMPVVEFSSTENGDIKRQTKGRRYDRPKSRPISELPEGEDVLPLSVHQVDVSALPVTQSDMVVVGQVLSRQAYLSNDRSAVYSEYPILVEDILKNRQQPLYIGQQIIVERWGGAVRFPSGKVQHYTVDKRGTPQLNEKYVFFLKCSEQNYDIITAYRVSDDRIDPLDSGLPFAKYEDASVQTFLADLKAAMQAR